MPVILELCSITILSTMITICDPVEKKQSFASMDQCIENGLFLLLFDKTLKFRCIGYKEYTQWIR